MGAISMGLSSNAALAPSNVKTSLILTGLTDGIAAPGDLLEAHLSNGAKIHAYAWGSGPGGSDYGTQPTLMVPPEAAGGVLHATAATKKRPYSASADVRDTSVAVTSILPEPDALLVQSLGPRLEPALKPSAGTDAIIVEIA